MFCVQDATHFDRFNLGLGWAINFTRIPFSFFLFVCVRVVEDKWWTLATFLCFFLFSTKIGVNSKDVFLILWGRWVGDSPRDILVEFGYRLKRTLKKVQIFAMCWQHTELVIKIWQKKKRISKYGNFEGFFLRKPFVRLALTFFCFQVANFHIKKHWLIHKSPKFCLKRLGIFFHFILFSIDIWTCQARLDICNFKKKFILA